MDDQNPADEFEVPARISDAQRRTRLANNYVKDLQKAGSRSAERAGAESVARRLRMNPDTKNAYDAIKAISEADSDDGVDEFIQTAMGADPDLKKSIGNKVRQSSPDMAGKSDDDIAAMWKGPVTFDKRREYMSRAEKNFSRAAPNPADIENPVIKRTFVTQENVSPHLPSARQVVDEDPKNRAMRVVNGKLTVQDTRSNNIIAAAEDDFTGWDPMSVEAGAMDYVLGGLGPSSLYQQAIANAISQGPDPTEKATWTPGLGFPELGAQIGGKVGEALPSATSHAALGAAKAVGVPVAMALSGANTASAGLNKFLANHPLLDPLSGFPGMDRTYAAAEDEKYADERAAQAAELASGTDAGDLTREQQAELSGEYGARLGRMVGALPQMMSHSEVSHSVVPVAQAANKYVASPVRRAIAEKLTGTMAGDVLSNNMAAQATRTPAIYDAAAMRGQTAPAIRSELASSRVADELSSISPTDDELRNIQNAWSSPAARESLTQREKDALGILQKHDYANWSSDRSTKSLRAKLDYILEKNGITNPADKMSAVSEALTAEGPPTSMHAEIKRAVGDESSQIASDIAAPSRSGDRWSSLNLERGEAYDPYVTPGWASSDIDKMSRVGIQHGPSPNVVQETLPISGKGTTTQYKMTEEERLLSGLENEGGFSFRPSDKSDPKYSQPPPASTPAKERTKPVYTPEDPPPHSEREYVPSHLMEPDPPEFDYHAPYDSEAERAFMSESDMGLGKLAAEPELNDYEILKNIDELSIPKTIPESQGSLFGEGDVSRGAGVRKEIYKNIDELSIPENVPSQEQLTMINGPYGRGMDVDGPWDLRPKWSEQAQKWESAGEVPFDVTNKRVRSAKQSELTDKTLAGLPDEAVRSLDPKTGNPSQAQLEAWNDTMLKNEGSSVFKRDLARKNNAFNARDAIVRDAGDLSKHESIQQMHRVVTDEIMSGNIHSSSMTPEIESALYTKGPNGESVLSGSGKSLLESGSKELGIAKDSAVVYVGKTPASDTASGRRGRIVVVPPSGNPEIDRMLNGRVLSRMDAHAVEALTAPPSVARQSAEKLAKSFNDLMGTSGTAYQLTKAAMGFDTYQRQTEIFRILSYVPGSISHGKEQRSIVSKILNTPIGSKGEIVSIGGKDYWSGELHEFFRREGALGYGQLQDLTKTGVDQPLFLENLAKSKVAAAPFKAARAARDVMRVPGKASAELSDAGFARLFPGLQKGGQGVDDAIRVWGMVGDMENGATARSAVSNINDLLVNFGMQSPLEKAARPFSLFFKWQASNFTGLGMLLSKHPERYKHTYNFMRVADKIDDKPGETKNPRLKSTIDYMAGRPFVSVAGQPAYVVPPTPTEEAAQNVDTLKQTLGWLKGDLSSSGMTSSSASSLNPDLGSLYTFATGNSYNTNIPTYENSVRDAKATTSKEAYPTILGKLKYVLDMYNDPGIVQKDMLLGENPKSAAAWRLLQATPWANQIIPGSYHGAITNELGLSRADRLTEASKEQDLQRQLLRWLGLRTRPSNPSRQALRLEEDYGSDLSGMHVSNAISDFMSGASRPPPRR